MFCESGKQKIGGNCVACERGYYKNNTDGLFGDCMICPIDKITVTTGSTSMSDCNIGKKYLVFSYYYKYTKCRSHKTRFFDVHLKFLIGCEHWYHISVVKVWIILKRSFSLVEMAYVLHVVSVN